MDETKQPGLRIAQIFLAAAHFEHRPDFLSVPATTHVEVPMTVNLNALLTEDGSAGYISVVVSTTDAPDLLYRFRVEMIGVVQADASAPNLSPQEYLTKQGPAMMYPFVRQVVADITARGRFGPLWLNPFNLAALETTSSVMPGLEAIPSP